jgi:serine/threonine protein phosphatase PrpC
MIRDVLERDPDPQSVCDTLIQQALELGGRDNVTVVVCDLREV